MAIKTIKDIDIEALAERFTDNNLLPNHFYTNIVTTIIVEARDETIFEYNHDHGTISSITDKYREEADEIFRMSNTNLLSFEFTPNNTVKMEYDNKYFYPEKGDRFGKKIDSSNAYDEWFKSVFDCFSRNIILIPDTNFLLNCYYSNYFRRVLDKNRNKVSIELSRLTLLEIERQINDLSAKIETIKKSLKKPENSKKVNEIEALLEKNRRNKRLKLQSIGEVAEIIRNGGRIVQPTDDTLLRSFPRASGSSFSDS